MLNINSQLDLVFSALADPTRRAIVARLCQGEATVGELASPFQISAPAVSRHLKVLEEAELVIRIKDGQKRRMSLNAEKLKSATDWLEEHRNFWLESFNRLDTLLEKK